MLIEIRIGSGKWKLKKIMHDAGVKCGVGSGKIQKIPHLTLYGPFSDNAVQIDKIKHSIERIGNDYAYLPFLIDDFEVKESPNGNGQIFAFRINASELLKKFRESLTKELKFIAPSPQPWDNGATSWFHISLALHLTKSEVDRLWQCLHGKNSSLFDKILRFFGLKKNSGMKNLFYLPMYGLRITLLSNKKKIICEYDLLQKRWLSRGGALNRFEWKNTLKLFRIKKGIEVNKNEQIAGSSKYFISDLHLDHSNIINYCARPFLFSDVGEMNHVLINNWNNVVKNSDTIYFVGDLTFGKMAKPSDFYLKRLNGNIEFIRGNHEENIKDSKPYLVLEYKNYKFLILHNPNELPAKWNGWIIHGHTHNNDIVNYPFINGERKTINVSAELINYKPISIDFLLSLDLNSIKRMDTIDSTPEKF